MGRRRRPPTDPRTRVVATGVLALLLLGACGAAPPATLVVQPLAEVQLLLTEARSTVDDGYEGLTVTRTVALVPGRDGAVALRPRDVHVHARLYETTPGGERRQLMGATGQDRAAQAVHQPLLAPFWGVSRFHEGRLDIGLPLPGGRIHGPDVTLQDAAPSVDDALPFLIRRVPDAVLALVASSATGAWPLDARRRIEFQVRRADDLPVWDGRLDLHRVNGPAWRVVLEVDMRWEGPFAHGLPWTVEHRVTGLVSVFFGGRVAGADLESWTSVHDEEGQPFAKACHRIEVGNDAPPSGAREADDFAHLLALRTTGDAAYEKAVLQATADTARAQVQRLRPRANLEDISVFLGGTVNPRSWPHGKPSVSASIGAAVHVLDAWRGPIGRLFETGAADAHPDPRGGEAPKDGEKKATEDADASADEKVSYAYSWPAVGAITVGRGVISYLDVLAHEYAHFANDRFEYPDLERVGFSWTDRDEAFVDIDGLLAQGLLGEAQAVATAWCAAHALYDVPGQHRLLNGFAARDTTPPAEGTDRERLDAVAYGNSPAVLAPQCTEGNDLEAVIARTWAEYSYQTHQVMWPRDPAERTALWPKALALKEDGAIGATRVGAWTLLLFLEDLDGGTGEDDLEIVRGLADDVLVRSVDGLLWITVWRDEAAAERYVRRKLPVKDGTRLRTGRHVIETTGILPTRERPWRRALLSREEDPAAWR